MAAIGGPVVGISIGGREFAVAHDADGSRKLGGTENSIEMNGNGTGRIIKTAVAWAVSGLTVSVDDDNGDQEFLQNVADSNGFEDMDITLASGATWQGSGTVTGELTFSTGTSLASFDISGPGNLTQQ